MTRSYPLLLYFSTAMALLGSVQFGYQIAVLNTSLHQVSATLAIPASYASVVVSTVLVGALVGALGAGSLADRLGPKKATVLNTLPFALGSILCAWAPSLPALLCGRLLCGVGTGAASLFVPRYLSEIAPTPVRGLLGTLNQLFINAGICVAFGLGWAYEADPEKSVTLFGTALPWWRVMFAAGVVPAVAQAAGMAVCPETPVWLLWSGLHLQASRSYRALHGTLGIDFAAEEATETGTATAASTEDAAPLLDTHSQQHQYTPSVADSTTQPKSSKFATLLLPRYRRVMLLAAGLPLLQQFGGINTVILYGSDVFRAAGVSSPILANLAMGCINMATTIVAAGLMDRAGRKSLLTWSFAGMAGCLAAMAAFLLLPISAAAAARLAMLSILGYTVFFALGCGPVPWVYLPEVLPDAIKGPAQGLCTALNWFGNLAVGLSFPAMLRLLGLGGSYAVYAAFCTGAALFCAKYMVETKRRSLSAVHAELMRIGMEEN